MEVVCTSETSVYSNKTTRRYIPESSNLYISVCSQIINLHVFTFICVKCMLDQTSLSESFQTSVLSLCRQFSVYRKYVSYKICRHVCNLIYFKTVLYLLYRLFLFALTDKRSVEDDELPEVDQNTKKSLRSRAAAAAKSKWNACKSLSHCPRQTEINKQMNDKRSSRHFYVCYV
jgi:hypothetical protein